MANVNAPHGLQPVEDMSGRPYAGGFNLYWIPAADTSAYYVGDCVSTLTGTGSTALGSDVNGIPQCRKLTGAQTATAIRGVIIGFQVAPIGVGAGQSQGNAVNLNIQNVPATKANDYYAMVADDPDLVFEIQGDNTTTLNPATGGIGGTPVIGANAGYTVAAPSAAYQPLSATVLTTASINTTATLPLKIIGLPYRPNVDFTAYTPFLVIINVHELERGPGSTGA
jgi:hypothetical protein